MIVFSHWFWTHILYGKNLVSYHCPTRVSKHWCWISDIGQKFIPISDIVSDSAHFNPISGITIQAQSDIADHWYRTECPPMVKKNNSQYCTGNSIQGYKIIIVTCEQHIEKIHGKFLSYGQSHKYGSVHTWTAVFLEHLANTSFMASIKG
jgi:hypothetical protein